MSCERSAGPKIALAAHRPTAKRTRVARITSEEATLSTAVTIDQRETSTSRIELSSGGRQTCYPSISSKAEINNEQLYVSLEALTQSDSQVLISPSSTEGMTPSSIPHGSPYKNISEYSIEKDTALMSFLGILDEERALLFGPDVLMEKTWHG